MQKCEITKAATDKMARPSLHKKTVQHANNEDTNCIGLVYEVFSINQTHYHYEPNLSNEKTEITDCLLRITTEKNAGDSVYVSYILARQ